MTTAELHEILDDENRKLTSDELKEAEYIEREAFKRKLIDEKSFFPAIVERALEEMPTTDVVPKSEVERLQEALSKAEADVKNYMKVAEYQQSLSIKRYHEIKRLKEDIERLEDINERDVENIRLAKTEVAKEIFEEIDAIYSLFDDGDEIFVGNLRTELERIKKKYTEGSK